MSQIRDRDFFLRGAARCREEGAAATVPAHRDAFRVLAEEYERRALALPEIPLPEA